MTKTNLSLNLQKSSHTFPRPEAPSTLERSQMLCKRAWNLHTKSGQTSSTKHTNYKQKQTEMHSLETNGMDKSTSTITKPISPLPSDELKSNILRRAHSPICLCWCNQRLCATIASHHNLKFCTQARCSESSSANREVWLDCVWRSGGQREVAMFCLCVNTKDIL